MLSVRSEEFRSHSYLYLYDVTADALGAYSIYLRAPAAAATACSTRLGLYVTIKQLNLLVPLLSSLPPWLPFPPVRLRLPCVVVAPVTPKVLDTVWAPANVKSPVMLVAPVKSTVPNT